MGFIFHPVGKARVGFVVRRVGEFDGHHKARATNIRDFRRGGADRFELLLQPRAKFIGAGAELFFLDHIQHRIGGRDPDRVAAIGAAQTARMCSIHDRGFAGQRSQRQAASQTFGHRGNIGSHAILLHAEHGAGAGKTGLHLVGDHDDAMLITERADGFDQIFRCGVESTFALHGFKDDGGDAAGIDVSLEEFGQPRHGVGG